MWWMRFGACIVFMLVTPWATLGEMNPPVLTPTAVTSKQAVTPQQFQVTLEQQFRQQFPMKDIDFSVDVLFPKKPIEVPKGKMGIQIPLDTMNGRTGRRSIRGAIHVNEKFEQMVNLVADIRARMKVVAPVRFIKAQEILQSEDIQMIDADLPALQHDFLKHTDMAIGKKALRILSPNLPIQQPYLADPPVVHKGDRVVLEVRQGALVVQTVGIAKASGESGKTIAVKNQSSGREVLGKIVNSGLVQVLF